MDEKITGFQQEWQRTSIEVLKSEKVYPYMKCVIVIT